MMVFCNKHLKGTNELLARVAVFGNKRVHMTRTAPWQRARGAPHTTKARKYRGRRLDLKQPRACFVLPAALCVRICSQGS